MDKSAGRVRQMFGEIAHRYDLLNHLLSGGIDYYWRWRAVRMAPPNGGAPVLDVCTGTGDLALAYYRRGQGRVDVVGADFTHEMLRLALRKAATRAKAERGGPSFIEADAMQLPFSSDSFGVVCVAFGLRNVADTERGLREMIRVCRPGGRVLVLEFSTPRRRVLRGAYLWYFRHVLPRLGQWLARNRQSAYNYLPQSVSEFPQGPALTAIMTGCGLTQVQWKPLTFGIASLYCGVKPG